MNFKLIFFSLIFTYVGCGVKGPPRPPAGTELPPMHQKYLQEYGVTTPKNTNNKGGVFDDEFEAR